MYNVKFEKITRKFIFTLASLVLIFPALFPGRALPGEITTEFAYDKLGPYALEFMDFSGLKDLKRNNRNVPLKIYYPKKGKDFPLVIMSHGAMGNRKSMIYQAQHVASHGYVVICTEHVFSNFKRLKYYRRRSGGRKKIKKALQLILRHPESVLQRPKDISFAIDQATTWNKQHKVLKGKIDVGKVAVMGHSYGAYTTLVVCGARPILDHLNPSVESEEEFAVDLSDDRVLFGFAMSPQGPGSIHFNEDSYKTVNRPLICLSGTKDRQQGLDGKELPAEIRLEVFSLLPAGEKYFLWFTNADHMSFAHHKTTVFFPSRARKDVQRICKAMMVLFCDHFLKGKEGTKNKMNKEYINSLCGKIVRKVKWYEK